MRRSLVTVLLALAPAAAVADFRQFEQVPVDPVLEEKLHAVAAETLAEFPKLAAADLALSVVDVTDPAAPRRADHQGAAPFYPASVIKLFFMADAYLQRVERSAEVQRALREMITVSDNDATAFLLDVLTDTCGGPELEGRALQRFLDKRRTVSRHFAALGYDVSAMLKPWSYGPFGRDLQALGPDRQNRNRVTANAVASLLLWMVRREAVSPAASEAMLALLERPLAPPRDEENQVKEFLGEALPAGSRLWSKAGWTSEVRHDAAYVELPGGRKLVIVVLTRGTADDVTLLPAIGRKLVAALIPRPPPAP